MEIRLNEIRCFYLRDSADLLRLMYIQSRLILSLTFCNCNNKLFILKINSVLQDVDDN